MPEHDMSLSVELDGSLWQAQLKVPPPGPGDPKPKSAEFSVPWSDRSTLPIAVDVRYSTGVNAGDGWKQWHVKIYRCRTAPECEALRMSLRRQAADIQEANTLLPGPPRIPIDPPWAVVPVQIVRGDGVPENHSGTRTRLGAPPLPPVMPGFDYPKWFAESPEAASQTILAVSPSIEEAQWADVCQPLATYHVAAFERMAKGLDILHGRNIVHSDINPRNVRRYWEGDTFWYALIDADAATRTQPEPLVSTIRFTWPYAHRHLVDAKKRGAPGELADARMLLAHDRLCFAILVLSAVFGVRWVEFNLLRAYDPDEPWRRPVDDHAAVLAKLESAWPPHSPRDHELLAVLTEPFKQAVLHDQWSALEWIRGIREVLTGLGPKKHGELLRSYRRHLDRTRTSIRELRPGKDSMGDVVMRRIQETAADLAWRAARRRLYGLTALFTVASLFIAASAFIQGK